MPDPIPHLRPDAIRPRAEESERERRKFYSSKRWLKERKRFLAKNPLCAFCLDRGFYVSAQVVHHKIERLDDPSLAWAWSNFQALCKSCHSKHHATGRFFKKAEVSMGTVDKPTISIDYHGVIKDHLKAQGGKNRTSSDDPEIEGSIDFLVSLTEMARVAVISARFAQTGRAGTNAMGEARSWLIAKGIEPSWITFEPDRSGKIFLTGLKVPSTVSLDDRAVCFTGLFPTPRSLVSFEPWNVQAKGST